MVFCPECGEEIGSSDERCGHCGWSLKNIREYMDVEYSRGMSLGKLVLLMVLTNGIYLFYWSYHNWKLFKVYKDLNVNPLLRTIGLLVPFINIYFTGRLFRDIRDYAEEVNVKTYSLLLMVVVWALFVFLSGRLALYANPVAALFSWIFLIGLIYPYSMVQRTLNRYWVKEQGNLPFKKGLSNGKTIILIIGLIFSSIYWFGMVLLFSGY